MSDYRPQRTCNAPYRKFWIARFSLSLRCFLLLPLMSASVQRMSAVKHCMTVPSTMQARGKTDRATCQDISAADAERHILTCYDVSEQQLPQRLVLALEELEEHWQHLHRRHLRTPSEETCPQIGHTSRGIESGRRGSR